MSIITEEVFNIDIVKEQINVASGENNFFYQENDKLKLVIPLNVESIRKPDNFISITGLVTTYHPPGGPGIRIDSLLYSGCSVTSFYDGLISKIISKGKIERCIMRLKRALDEYVIEGIDTNIQVL